MTLRQLLAAPLLSAALVCTIAAAPASAADPTPAPTASAATSATTSQYASLTSALMSMYATQSGSTLDSYLTANQLKVNAAQGTTTAAPGSGASLSANGVTVSDDARDLTASTSEELDAQLSDAGYSLDLRNYSTLSDLASDVVTKAATADATVTLAGAQWVSQLGSLRTPTLTSPTVGNATMPDIPQESLAFGLLMDQALANTVTQAPDLFAAASASGVGSEALSSVFGSEMLNAWSATSTSLTDMLPNKCTGAMLAVMASGDESAASDYAGCNPACTTGGLYLNDQASRVFDASSNQLSGNFDDTLWGYGTTISLGQWRTVDMLEQNPDLVQTLVADDGTAGNSWMCDTAQSSTQSALKDTLPDVFANLQVAK